MVPRYAAAFVIVFSSFLAPSQGQTQTYEKAKDGLREALKRPTVAERIAGIRAFADTKDVRGTDDLIAAIRVLEGSIEKKREEIERVGKENREIYKPIDDYITSLKEQGAKEIK